jgi:hypothetical protein
VAVMTHRVGAGRLRFDSARGHVISLRFCGGLSRRPQRYRER